MVRGTLCTLNEQIHIHKDEIPRRYKEEEETLYHIQTYTNVYIIYFVNCARIEQMVRISRLIWKCDKKLIDEVEVEKALCSDMIVYWRR